MFNSYLPYVQLTVHQENDQSFHVRTFVFRVKCGDGSYIVQFEEYIDNLFVVKFYPVQLKRDPNRYRLISNDNMMQAIVGTALHIFRQKLKGNKYASLGFIASSSIIGDFTEDQANNQRFRIYRQVMQNFFGQQAFRHFIDPLTSSYLMVNKENAVEKFVHKMQNGFRNLYPDIFDLHFTEITLRRRRRSFSYIPA